MAEPITTEELVARVREKTDEANAETVSDTFIYRSLNEGARGLLRIAARQYDQIFMDYTDLTVDSTGIINIPEDAFDRRIEFVEYSRNSRWERLKRVRPSRTAYYRTERSFRWPSTYTTYQNKLEVLPHPNSQITVRVWYTKRVGTLVPSEGRILSIGADSVVVDTLGSGLDVTVDDLDAFVNLIDAQTGLTKGSMQIASVDTDNNEITFKTTGLNRTEVLGKTIGTALPTDLEIDDYVTGIGGTCVLEMLADFSDYVVQYGVVEVRRALREENQADYAKLKELEAELETIWSGRENDNTITSGNPHWVRWNGRKRGGRFRR